MKNYRVWHILNSSHIHKVAYNRKTQTLSVVFKDHSHYEVSPVEFKTYVKFKKAESPGGFYNAFIADNDYYTIKRVGAPPVASPQEQRVVLEEQLEQSMKENA